MYIRIHINVQTTPYKAPVVLVRFLRFLGFPDKFSKKFSNVDYYCNPFSEGRFVLRGRTDGRTDRLLTVTFYKFANAPKNTLSKATASSVPSDFFSKLPSLRSLRKPQAEASLTTPGCSQLQVNSGYPT
jgi:hypothetical protein